MARGAGSHCPPRRHLPARDARDTDARSRTGRPPRAGKGIIVGRGDNALPLVYVDDAVQGLLLALDHERAIGQAFNITNDRPITQQQFFTAIAHELGVRRPRVHIPYPALYAAGYTA